MFTFRCFQVTSSDAPWYFEGRGQSEHCEEDAEEKSTQFWRREQFEFNHIR